MLKVGITGGIGSGKTTVCQVFSQLGVPIYYADVRAKQLMNENPEIVKKITQLFGEQAYTNGKLNRAFLAEKVFPDKNLLKQLNAIVHPAVIEDSIRFFQTNLDKPYVLYEAAILMESGNYKAMDKVIVVYAPAELRIERVMKRDEVSREQVESRMKQQQPDEEKLKLADFVVYNDGSQTLVEQVLTIHQALLAAN